MKNKKTVNVAIFSIYKIYIFILITVFLCGCAADENSQELVESEQSAETAQDEQTSQAEETKQDEQGKITYDDLNTQAFHDQLYKEPLGQELFQAVQEFRETAYEGEIVPAELVFEVEKLLYEYDACLSSNDEWTDVDLATWIESMGRSSYAVSAEKIMEQFPEIGNKCIGAFRFPLTEETTGYITCNGGTSGFGYISFFEEHDGRLEEIDWFEVQEPRNNGEVILYDSKYYYVRSEYNCKLNRYDTIQIYCIGPDLKENNVQVRYVPENYVWKALDSAMTIEDEELKDYIEKSKSEVMSEEYIERGQRGMFTKAYGAGEEDVDFANIGDSVHVEKWINEPNSHYAISYMKMVYTYQDHELNCLEDDGFYFPVEGNLKQMWFAEIGGTVYTFQLYAREDYSYMLNVVKVEGDQISTLWREQAVPQKHFVICEREVFYSM